MGLSGSVCQMQLKTCFAVPNQVSFFLLPWFCSLLKWQCLLTVLEAQGTRVVMKYLRALRMKHVEGVRHVVTKV